MMASINLATLLQVALSGLATGALYAIMLLRSPDRLPGQ